MERSSAIGSNDMSQPRAQKRKQKKKDGEDLQVREKEGGETTMIHRVFLSDLGEMRCRTTNTAWS